MADSDFEKLYHHEIDVEVVEGYRPGGFHPTIIGDTFCDGRYSIVHKLGYGSYSSIWLARDHRLSRYVALKILIADESQESGEGGILRLLAKGDPNCVGRQFIPPLLDEFFFDGPNGRHLCLVQEPAGYNVAASKENSSNCKFPRDAARSIAAQLIMGIYYLHKNDICHGGMLPQALFLRLNLLGLLI